MWLKPYRKKWPYLTVWVAENLRLSHRLHAVNNNREERQRLLPTRPQSRICRQPCSLWVRKEAARPTEYIVRLRIRLFTLLLGLDPKSVPLHPPPGTSWEPSSSKHCPDVSDFDHGPLFAPKGAITKSRHWRNDHPFSFLGSTGLLVSPSQVVTEEGKKAGRLKVTIIIVVFDTAFGECRIRSAALSHRTTTAYCGLGDAGT